MADVFAEATKNPGKITQGGSSMNSDEAMMGRTMQRIKGVSWKFVSFDKEVESVTAVLGGHINMAFVNPTSCMEQIRAGNLKVIIVAAPERYKAFPDAPTIEEAGLGRSRASYRAVFGPPDMPKYAQKGWEAAMKKFLAHDLFQKYMADAMMQEKYMNGDELGAYWENAGAIVKQDFIDAGMLNPDGSIKEKK
jgi:putative tricarboxylic transport membrane protein